MKLLLAPLDERPVNTRYPQMVAAIAGAELVLPPVEVRGSGRTPADTVAVSEWLQSEARDADGVVASVEFLAWGGTISEIRGYAMRARLLGGDGIEQTKQGKDHRQ